MIRTRFAPSPTGYLHIGGARTALFSWAYARRHGGTFVLRIEDTDLERSTQASVDAILDGMRWLGLDWDEGPFFQMHRLDRYREVAEKLVAKGAAYYCYATRDELEAMREQQRQRGEKPRYDGRWRPERAEALGLKPPPGAKPVVRFRNPDSGIVSFEDMVKGTISVANEEIDDLVILRADGVPTYNFGVVIDDLDMEITHVIRGDDHVNNTPRQVNIFRAILEGTDRRMPHFAHVPMILGSDGERLSKRHGAVSVMQYRDDGFLPAGMTNYLARLGWSHGDDEVFTREQFVDWFDLEHVSRSPAQFDPAKLRWINQQHMKTSSVESLAGLVRGQLESSGIAGLASDVLDSAIALLRDRSETLQDLATGVKLFSGDVHPTSELTDKHLSAPARTAMLDLANTLASTDGWTAEVIGASIKAVLGRHKLKMPELAIPVRVTVFGQPQSPDLAQSLHIAGRTRVLSRLNMYGGNAPAAN